MALTLSLRQFVVSTSFCKRGHNLKTKNMYTFSFIDMGLEDFIRTPSGDVLKKKFPSYEDAEEFIMDGGLSEFEWTNEGTRKFCWDYEKDGFDVP